MHLKPWLVEVKKDGPFNMWTNLTIVMIFIKKRISRSIDLINGVMVTALDPPSIQGQSLANYSVAVKRFESR